MIALDINPRSTLVARAVGLIPVGFILHCSSKVGAITAGKGQQQEHEAAGHTASTVRKPSEMDAGAQLASFFLFSLRPQPRDSAAHIPILINPFLKCPSQTWRGAFLLSDSRSSQVDHQ